MKRTLLILCLVAAIGAAWVVWGQAGFATGEVAADDSTRDATGRDDLLADDRRSPGKPVGSGMGERADLRRPARDEPAIVLFGRCVEAESRTPVGGVRLSLEVEFTLMEPSDDRKAERWNSSASTISAADGTFELRVARTALPLRLVADSHYVDEPESFEIESEESIEDNGGRQDLGDVELIEGFPVRGMVVNHRGEPLSREVLSFSGDHSTVVHDGRFDFGLLHPDDYDVELLRGSGVVVAPSRIRVGPRQDTTNLRITVNEYPALEGVVLDASTDAPVAGWQLQAELFPNGHVETVTDEKGRFRICGASLGPEFVRFSRADVAGELNVTAYLDAPSRWFPLPARDVVLRLRSLPAFLIRATRDDGSVVEDFDLYGYRIGEVRRLGPTATGDAVRFVGLPPGPIRIRVLVKTPRFASSAWVEFDPAHWREKPFEVRVQETVDLRVHVDVPKRLKQRASVSSYKEGAKGMGWFSGVNADDDGDALLPIPENPSGYSVLVVAGRTRVRVRLDASHGIRRELNVELVDLEPENPAELRIRVTGVASSLGAGMLRSYLAIRRRGSDVLRHGRSSSFTNLHPGEWEVLVHVDKKVWIGPNRSIRVTRPERILTRVTLRPNEKRIVDVALPELTPGRIRGTATHDGQPLRNTRLIVRAMDHLWSRQVSTDGDGRFECSIPHGTYRIDATGYRIVGLTEERRLCFPRTVEVGPGEVVDRDFDTGRASLRVRILSADGEPVANAWFDVDSYGRVRSDARGRIDIRPVPPGEVTIRAVSTPDARERAARIERPFPERKVLEVVLR